MKANRNDMPSKLAINDYHGRDKADNCCMACERETALHRAHIIPLVSGGSNELNNFHLLCPTCHHESEGWIGKAYTAWYEARQEGADTDGAYNAALSVVLKVANERLSQDGLSENEKRAIESQIVKQFRG